VGWLESPKPCCWTGERLHHGDDVCALCLLVKGVFFILFLRLNPTKWGGFGMGKKLIRQVPMTKDVKVVKSIKKSVQVFVIFVPMAIYLGRNQCILCRA
jgi:hypothetical protein